MIRNLTTRQRPLIWATTAFVATGVAATAFPAHAAEPPERPTALVIHGGAGTLLRADLTPELEAEYRATLSAALRAGHEVLAAGGRSLDAVEVAVKLLEDSPLFNAGRGSVFNADGRVEMDAAIMDGTTRAGGAVTGVTRVKNPIRAARAVMERTEHVMLAGPGVEALAIAAGIQLVDPSYFFTERRWGQLVTARAKAAKVANVTSSGPIAPPDDAIKTEAGFGTVGAVALDRQGHLAAATSTGGRTNKMPGRVGDTPVLGAGTWADSSCAVSGTGHGEFFIRYAVAHEICARVAHGNLDITTAARQVVTELAAVAPDSGGVIALDRNGHFAMELNTSGMYRGSITGDGVPQVEIFASPNGPQSKVEPASPN